jgi:hypothetical protein
VLGPRSNANRRESVVPADPTAASDQGRSTPAPQAASRTAEDDKLARELAAFEQELTKREHDVAMRERELAEQRRVLADQYRLLKAQPQQAPHAVAGAASASAVAWPPAAAGTKTPLVRGGSRHVQAPAFASYQSKRRSGLWRRVKNTLLGIPEPVLEDSL